MQDNSTYFAATPADSGQQTADDAFLSLSLCGSATALKIGDQQVN